MRAALFVAALLAAASAGRAEEGCMPTYAFRCPCRPNCDQVYCEKYCWLCGTTPTQCQYCCNPTCACGAIGKSGPGQLLDFTVGLLASRAEAAEVPMSDGPKEHSNAHGDFLIVPKSKTTVHASGIGVRLVKSGKELRIAEVFKDGPAEKAGLKTGDALLSIAGRKTDALDLRAAAAALRGKAGSRVKLVVRGADGTTLSTALVRADFPASAAISKEAVSFKLVPASEGDCAPRAGDCLYLYRSAEGCHYTCKRAAPR